MKKNIKLNIDQLKKFLFEDISDTDINTVEGGTTDNATGLYTKLPDEQKQIADQLVNKAISTGRSGLTHETAKNKKIFPLFNYFTTKLASLYKTDTEHKDNIRNALMSSFLTHDIKGNTTSYFNLIRQGINGMTTGAAAMAHDDTDIIMDALISAFDRALSFFNPNKTATFSSVLLQTSIHNAVNIRNSKANKIPTRSSSIDAQMGSDEEGGETFADRLAAGGDAELGYSAPHAMTRDDQREEAKIKFQAIDTAIRDVLSMARSKEYLTVYEMIMDGIGPKEMAAKLGKSVAMIDQLKTNMSLVLGKNAEKIENYIKNKTGYQVKLPVVTSKSGEPKFMLPTLKEALEIIDAQLLNENGVINFDTTHLYNPAEDLTEKEIVEKLLSEIEVRFNKMNNIHSKMSVMVKQLNEGSEVDVLDLFDHVKQYVDNCLVALSELHEDLNYLTYGIGDTIGREYPDIRVAIEKTTSPIIDAIQLYPGQLKTMLHQVRIKYNPTRSYGIGE